MRNCPFGRFRSAAQTSGKHESELRCYDYRRRVISGAQKGDSCQPTPLTSRWISQPATLAALILHFPCSSESCHQPSISTISCGHLPAGSLAEIISKIYKLKPLSISLSACVFFPSEVSVDASRYQRNCDDLCISSLLSGKVGRHAGSCHSSRFC